MTLNTLLSPHFKDRWALLMVSEEAYKRLELDSREPDARLAEHGFKSGLLEGVPVIYSSEIVGETVIALHKDLIQALARKD